MDHYKKARQEAVLSPRLLSVVGFQNLFEQALTHSWLRRRQDETDEEIKKLKEEIAGLKVRDQELKDNIDANDKSQSDARAEYAAKQSEQNSFVQS